ncbi:MAG: MarR family transcriptional regulator [Phycisphaeraceae bacterium]|nr:MarR family transcriptional regulator [Phycisphaeraceae bacterium]
MNSPASNQDRPTDQVLSALRRIIRAIDLHSRFLVQRYGLTGPQLTVLKELSRIGQASISELAKAVHLSHATVTGIISRLEKRQMVHRMRCEADKRQILVSVSDKTRKMLLETPPMLQESFTEQFNRLEQWEQHQILASLHRLVSMMEAKHLDATPILITGPIDASSENTEAFLQD